MILNAISSQHFKPQHLLTFFPLENFLVLKFDDPFEHSPISEQTLILP